MEPKGSTAIVGFFVLLFGVGIVASVLWLSGSGRGPQEVYVVRMKESVSGLSTNAAVKYRGVDVGSVTHLGFSDADPAIIELTLTIDEKTPVREDTRAMLEYQGFTGLAFVNLVGGSKESPQLSRHSGERYPVIESAPSLFNRLDESVTTLLASLTETSDRIANVLETIDSESLDRTIGNLEKLTGALEKRSAEIDASTVNAARLFRNAAVASEDLPALVASFEKLTREWNATGTEVRVLAQEGRTDLQRASTEVTASVDGLTADLQQLVRRLDRVVGDLETDPSSVLFGPAPNKKGPGE